MCYTPNTPSYKAQREGEGDGGREGESERERERERERMMTKLIKRHAGSTREEPAVHARIHVHTDTHIYTHTHTRTWVLPLLFHRASWQDDNKKEGEAR